MSFGAMVGLHPLLDSSQVGLGDALYGAASVFMAYEGFQLLTYDYDDIETPDRTLPRAVMSAIVVVIGVYVMVALGTVMLVGADAVVRQKEAALAVGGQQTFGVMGLVVVTIGAAFSTGSAVNSTPFATARLAGELAEDSELPVTFDHLNRAGVPGRAVVGLGGLAAVPAAFGSLPILVEAASLAFLFTFVVVCGLALRAKAGRFIVTAAGTLTGAGAFAALVVRMARFNPLSLAARGCPVLVAVFARPWLLTFVRTEADRDGRS